ncbi:hypothetical protein KXD40_003410 [Peronospora effusa]|nr:hypothetical protein KXD40_003410 [Peronospora effusa]
MIALNREPVANPALSQEMRQAVGYVRAIFQSTGSQKAVLAIDTLVDPAALICMFSARFE